MSRVERDDPRLVFMPEDQVLAASGIVQVLRERWFVVCPARGLLFWQADRRRTARLQGASPQCNAAERIARLVHGEMFPWAEVRRIPLVLQPVDLQDFR